VSCQELRATKEIVRRAYARRVSLVIRGIPYPCHSCAYDDVAVAAIHLEGITDVYHVVTTESGLALAYVAELLEMIGHPQAATIKARRSRTSKETYVSNGCLRCDALFGDFFISEKLAEVLASGEVASLPALGTIRRSPIEWYALADVAVASDM
jgi:hypothetical protein